jgi:hypothetical protein
MLRLNIKFTKLFNLNMFLILMYNIEKDNNINDLDLIFKIIKKSIPWNLQDTDLQRVQYIDTLMNI